MIISGTRRGWLAVSLLILLASLILLVVCSWQTIKLRSQKAATTDFALTLTRLAQWNVDVADGSAASGNFTGDGTAQLVATGDVQARVIQRLLDAGVVGEFNLRGSELLTHWQSVRSAYSELNQAAVQSALTTGDTEVMAVGLTSARSSYELLFDAIISESLSRPLLRLASEIRSHLVSLEVLSALGLGSEAQGLLVELGVQAKQLANTVRPSRGPAILGYNSTLKLTRFLESLSEVQISGVVADQQDSKPQESNVDLAAVTAVGLRFTQSLLTTIDMELTQSQRNALLAALLLSVSLLATAAMVWLGRRSSEPAVESNEEVLTAIRHDLTRLAEGAYTHQSTAPRNTPSAAAVAATFDRVSSVVGTLQRLSKDKFSQTASLALQQQELIESIESRLTHMSEGHSERSEKILSQLEELQAWVTTAKDRSSVVQPQTEMIDAVNDTASSLARLTAQLELCNGRIDSALKRTQKLQNAVQQVESNARQSGLQAINESIKLSDYYDEDGETEQFVQSMQRISDRLQLDADAALQSMVDMRADLNACCGVLNECLSAAEQSARYTADASQVIKQSASCDVTPDIDIGYLQALLNSLAAEVQQASLAGKASVPQDDLLYLKGHALEVQLLAAEYNESSSGGRSAEPRS